MGDCFLFASMFSICEMVSWNIEPIIFFVFFQKVKKPIFRILTTTGTSGTGWRSSAEAWPVSFPTSGSFPVRCGNRKWRKIRLRRRCSMERRRSHTKSWNTRWNLLSLFVHQWRSNKCKCNARWVHTSQLKASVVYFFRKTCNVNKTYQLKPRKGAGIWRVM